MKPAIVFPQYALAVWTLSAPLVVAIVEWFATRRQRSVLTQPTAESPASASRPVEQYSAIATGEVGLDALHQWLPTRE